MADVSITSDPGASSSIVTNVIVTPGDEQIGVTWTIDQDLAGTFNGITDVCDYLIFYAISASGPWTLYDDGVSTAKSATITGISTFTTTFVKVVPIRCSTQCPDVESDVAWAIPTRQEPGQIKVFFVNPEQTTVMLDWNKPRTGGSEITLYEIERRNQYYNGTYLVWQSWNTVLTGLPTPDTYNRYTHQDTGLSVNTMYQYKIRAVNAEGNAIFSNMREAMTSGNFQNFVNGTAIPDDFDFNAPGTTFDDDQVFNGTKNFGSGQTFGDGTEFADGQTFDDDVNFSGSGIQFRGATFQNAETFGAGADFHGTQNFTGTNTFGDQTTFTGIQDFSTGVQSFGVGTRFSGISNFAANQEFAVDTVFAPGQEFGSGTNFNFGGVGMGFGNNTDFGKSRTFGGTANFTAGASTFVGTNTFGAGTQFAEGQTFDDAQNFGANMEFEANMEFGTGQAFVTDYDFNKSDLTFGDNTSFCSGETIGADADFSAGTSRFGGASTFNNGTKFYAGQDFSANTHTFTDHQTFGADTEFKVGQPFAGDVAFSGLFDFSDMVGKSLVFEEAVDFFMPASGEALGVPSGTSFGDNFDRASMFEDLDGDGVNDKRHMFEAGVIFAADTTFPPRTEFVGGFSFDDMDGKEFTFEEGNFMGGTPHFPSGQTIKPGIMWGSSAKI